MSRPGTHGKHLLGTLAARACVVVTDDFPCFMLPRMVEAAAPQIPTRFEVVDSNGLLPMRAARQVYARAFDFRRFLQGVLPAHLTAFPKADPLRGLSLPRLAQLPNDIARRWPRASARVLGAAPEALETLPIDHSVGPAAFPGGAAAAHACLDQFVRKPLDEYPEKRNEPELNGTSGFSPYLHFGHISVHEIFARIARRERWSPAQLGKRATGKREGWWRMSAAAESFLDELVTWRELGFNLCSRQPGHYDRYESLPRWARERSRSTRKIRGRTSIL